ncbi:MAG TPA: CrcB family protein [Acidimicrobiales bacterium]|nr:CrcB family protein [Acidimicrobiales bacterium]
MALALAVGLAGAAGAVSRYLLDGWVQDRASGLFPFGTLTVNVIGSFILGVVAGVVLRHAGSSGAQAVIGTGFCGGMTTWSTAAWETVRLAEEGSPAVSASFTFANLAASLAAGGLGLVAALRA